MAIDTANKRASIIGGLPIPDGTLDRGDRVQCMGQYSGAKVGIIYYLTGVSNTVLSAAAIATLGATEELAGISNAVLSAALVPTVIIGLWGQSNAVLSTYLAACFVQRLTGISAGELTARCTGGIDGYNGLITRY